MAENANPPAPETVTETEPQEKETNSKPNGDPEMSAMEKASSGVKNFAAPLTIFSFLLSLPLIAWAIWLLYMKGYDCENVLRLPKLQTGICLGLIAVFLLSNVAVFLRSRFPVPALFLIMVPLIVMFTMGLALVGAYKMESRSIAATPMWLRFKIHDNIYWNDIKSCIFDTGACDELESRSFTLKSYDFNSRKLSPIESGCCRPPSSCGMEFVNATFWTREDVGVHNTTYSHDSDCDLWTNDWNALCYNCHSCKEGFRRTLQRKWKKLGIFLVLMSLLLVVAHILLFLATMWERFGG